MLEVNVFDIRVRQIFWILVYFIPGTDFTHSHGLQETIYTHISNFFLL